MQQDRAIKIGDVLKEMGVITDEELNGALETQKRLSIKLLSQKRPSLPDLVRRGESAYTRRLLLGEILLEEGVIQKEHLRKALLRQCQIIGPCRRKLRREQMEAVIELLGFINSTINLGELLDLIMEATNEVLHAEASSLMLLDENTGELIFSVPTGPKKDRLKEIRLAPGEGIAGWVAESGSPLLIPDVTKDPRFFQNMDQASGFSTRSMVCVPLRAKGKTLGVLQALNRRDGDPFNGEDLDLLTTFASQAAIALDNARLYSESLERQRLLQELVLAKEIQDRLLPKEFPEVDGLQVAGFISSAEEVSGDFYDFVVTEEGDLISFMGDVSGKGIPASLLMASTRSALRILLEDKKELTSALETVNRFVLRDSTAGSFVTMFICMYQPAARGLSYVNCGHTPSLLISADGVSELAEGGTVLGAFDGVDYPLTTINLARGDLILIYTDGLTEARSLSGELFGYERLMEMAQELRGMGATDALEKIKERLFSFSRHTHQSDDITLLVLGAT